MPVGRPHSHPHALAGCAHGMRMGCTRGMHRRDAHMGCRRAQGAGVGCSQAGGATQVPRAGPAPVPWCGCRGVDAAVWVPRRGARWPRYCCGRSSARSLKSGDFLPRFYGPICLRRALPPAINHSALGGSGERGAAGRTPPALVRGTSRAHLHLGPAQSRRGPRPEPGQPVSGPLGSDQPPFAPSQGATASEGSAQPDAPCRGCRRVPAAPLPARLPPSAPRLPAGLSAGGAGSAQRLPSLFRAFPGFYCLPLLVPPSSQEALGPGGAGGSVPSRTVLPACSLLRRRQRHGQLHSIPAPGRWLPAAAPTWEDGVPGPCRDTPSPARASLGSVIPAMPCPHRAEPLSHPWAGGMCGMPNPMGRKDPRAVPG